VSGTIVCQIVAIFDEFDHDIFGSAKVEEGLAAELENI